MFAKSIVLANSAFANSVDFGKLRAHTEPIGFGELSILQIVLVRRTLCSLKPGDLANSVFVETTRFR